MIGKLTYIDTYPSEGFIGFLVLFIGLVFTGIMFYFVFFRLNRDNDSFKDRQRSKLELNRQKEKIAKLYPKGNYNL
tara:strand:+ start:238 stop:465 length:228 start_codon:yes stop_codon:yes gene_type:complete